MRREALWSVGALLALLAGPSGRSAAEVIVINQHVENPNFNETDGSRAWTLDPRPWSSQTWSTLSQSGNPGSLRLFNSATGSPGQSSRSSQCVTDIVAGGSYLLEAYWHAPAGQPLHPDGGFVAAHLDFHGDEACEDLGFGGSYPLTLFGPGGNGGWQLLSSGDTVAPAGARSAALVLDNGRLSGQPAGASYANFDRVRLSGPHRFVKGSLLNRGETDLLLRNGTTGEHRVWFMNDERLAAYDAISPTPTLEWQAVGVDDFDGDGRNDLLMWRPLAGWLDFWQLMGVNRIGDPIPIGGSDPGPSWRPSATADFNHDGRPDIVLRDTLSQEIRIWTMNGTDHVGDITPTPGQAVNANWEIVGAGDLNGDGNTDFLWYNATSGRIVYWLMNASVARTLGAFTNPMAAGNNNWKVLAMGDYGLGPSVAPKADTLDLVWRNAASGRLVVWFMDRAGNRTSGLFTVPPDLPAPVTDWTVVGPR